MSVIEWDLVGSRRFEAGINRGVLYPPTGPGVAWNGLIGVDESFPAAPSPYYLDGIKYLDRQTFVDFSAKLKAFTYPEEFEGLVGVGSYGQGLTVYGQSVKRFGLSYRTGMGDDITGLGVGYKIHLVYNAVATPTSRGFSTVESNASAADFEWQIDTRPIRLPGFRPSAHFVIDTTIADAQVISDIEKALYGSDTTEPYLPDAAELFNIFAAGPVPDSTIDAQGGWTMTGDPEFFTMSDDGSAFAVRGVKTSHADAIEYTMGEGEPAEEPDYTPPPTDPPVTANTGGSMANLASWGTLDRGSIDNGFFRIDGDLSDLGFAGYYGASVQGAALPVATSRKVTSSFTTDNAGSAMVTQLGGSPVAVLYRESGFHFSAPNVLGATMDDEGLKVAASDSSGNTVFDTAKPYALSPNTKYWVGAEITNARIIAKLWTSNPGAYQTAAVPVATSVVDFVDWADVNFAEFMGQALYPKIQLLNDSALTTRIDTLQYS